MNMVKRLAAFVAVLCMVLALCACGGTDTEPQDGEKVTTTTADNTTTTTAPKVAAFEVTVVDQDGNPVADVMLQICKDTCIPAKTDANGVATFNVEVTDEHKLSVLSCPSGYTYTGEAEVYLENGITAFTVELQGE